MIPDIVSVDDHVAERADPWVRRLPPKYRDVGPRVVLSPYGQILGWIPEPTGMSWVYKIDERAPMRTPIDGLFLVAYTTEVTGVDYEAEAHSALEVANVIVTSCSSHLLRRSPDLRRGRR